MQIVSNDAISTYETMREWTRFDRKTFCSILSSCRKLCADIKSTKIYATTAEIKFIPPKVIEIKVWNILGNRYEYVPAGRVLQKHVQGYLSFSSGKGYNECATQNNVDDRVIDSHGVVVVFTNKKRG